MHCHSMAPLFTHAPQSKTSTHAPTLQVAGVHVIENRHRVVHCLPLHAQHEQAAVLVNSGQLPQRVVVWQRQAPVKKLASTVEGGG